MRNSDSARRIRKNTTEWIASFTFRREVTLLGSIPTCICGAKIWLTGVFPWRGARHPDVPHYNGTGSFVQLAKPMVLPAGSKIECTAHYDTRRES